VVSEIEIPQGAWDAARDAARPFAADIAEQVSIDPIHLAEIIGAGIAKASAAALEAAAPAIAAAAEERFAAAAREELAGPLAELGAQITREATAAERERCARLADEAGAIYPLPRPVPAVTVSGEPVGDTAGNTVIWPDGMPAVGLVSCLLRERS